MIRAEAVCAQTLPRLSEWFRPLLQRPKVGDNLPALRFGQARPGRHAVPQVSLAKKPLEIAVGRLANSLAAQGRLFVPVALRVGLVALEAMIAIEQRPGRNCIRLPGQRIGARVIPRRNTIPSHAGGSRHRQRRAQGNRKNRNPRSGSAEDGPAHSAPPCPPWNHSLTWFNSKASPTRYMRARLVDVRPKPGEKLSRIPLGSCHPMRGAT